MIEPMMMKGERTKIRMNMKSPFCKAKESLESRLRALLRPNRSISEGEREDSWE